VVGDLGEDPCEPGLRVDAVELGGLNQGIGDCRGLADTLGADEEKILPAQGYTADRSFGRVIVQFQESVCQISAHFLHAAKGVADRLGEIGFVGNPVQLSVQPKLQIIEDQLGVSLAQRGPLFWGFPARRLFDPVKKGDAFDRFFSNLQALRLEYVNELASHVRHAGHLVDIVLAEEIVEPSIPIRVHPALELAQMTGGMFAFAVSAELVPCGGWISTGPRPLVADIGPDPGRRAFLFGLHFEGCVIREYRLTGPDVSANDIGQRLQQLCRLADPSCQRGAIQVNSFAGEDLALTI